MLTKELMEELSAFIKWDAVFLAAGLVRSTMRSAVKKRKLRPDEVKAILLALNERGIYLRDAQLDIFH